jgi:hypothetical protein
MPLVEYWGISLLAEELGFSGRSHNTDIENTCTNGIKRALANVQ